jgi:hypothetical protein
MPPSSCYGAGQLGRGALWDSLGGKIRKIRTFPLGDFIEFASGRLWKRSLTGSFTEIVSVIGRRGSQSAVPRRWGALPYRSSVPQYARAAVILGNPARGECAYRMALADPLPETHHLLWERSAAVLYAWKEQRGMPSS